METRGFATVQQYQWAATRVGFCPVLRRYMEPTCNRTAVRKAVMMEDVENANHGRRGAEVPRMSHCMEGASWPDGYTWQSTSNPMRPRNAWNMDSLRYPHTWWWRTRRGPTKPSGLAISPSLKAYGLPGRPPIRSQSETEGNQRGPSRRGSRRCADGEIV